MKNYIIRRILLAFPILLAVTFIAFSLTTIIPSDPAKVVLRVNEILATPDAIAQMREQLGLNDPFLLRYVYWLNDLFHFDLGNSYINDNRTVVGEITRSLPATLKLAFLSFIIVVGVSIPLGILSAVYKDSLFDRIIRFVVFIGTAMPNYWFGLLLIWFFALHLGWLPTSGATSFKHYILPSLTLSLAYISTYVRLMRNSILENMKEDYIFYAQVRGIKKSKIILKHLVRNSLQTTINALGMSIVMLIAGTFVIESIFAIPGIGRLCLNAIFNRDYPIIQAYILMMGVLFVVFNLLVDILQVYIDPRIAKGLKA